MTLPFFQFPVGMSNRSYLVQWMDEIPAAFTAAFNSPWECRIGLTITSKETPDIAKWLFQFPVGMSNRSYCATAMYSPSLAGSNFQFPVGMSNRSY